MKQTTVNIDLYQQSDGFVVSGGTTARHLIVSGTNLTLAGTGTAVVTTPTSSTNLAGINIVQTFTTQQTIKNILTVNQNPPTMQLSTTSGQSYIDLVGASNNATYIRHYINSNAWLYGATATGFATAFDAAVYMVMNTTPILSIGKNTINTGFPFGSVDILGDCAVTGSIRNDDVVYPRLLQTSGGGTGVVQLVIIVDRLDATPSARQYHHVSWWLSRTDKGAPQTLNSSTGQTIARVDGLQIDGSGVSLPANISVVGGTSLGLQHWETTSSRRIVVTITPGTASGDSFLTHYLMAEIQGILYSIAFEVDIGA